MQEKLLKPARATLAGTIGILLMLLVANPASAAVQMHGLFTSDMILQRNEQVAVHGTANAGEVVTVQFTGQTKVATADAGRRWKVLLDAMPASSTGRTMSVTSNAGSSVSLANILVGDIWILGGQSNMDNPFATYDIAKQDIVGVNKNQIRLFRTDNSKGKRVPQSAVVPHASLLGKWQNATQTHLNSFSPAGYYMADRLNKELGVPIGLIHAALGSTNIESWLPVPLVESTREYEFMTGNQWPSNVMSQAEITAGDEMARRGTSGLYNYTVAPLRGFGFKGFVWYQGESSSRRPWVYRRQLTDLITSWRQDFGKSNAPFLIVEIAPHGAQYDYERAAWLREAQSLARTLPNTGYVTTVDIGEFTDIHPQAKKPVGERLAYTALEMDGLAYKGQPPSYRSMKVAGNTLEIDFNGVTALSTKEVRMNHDPNLPVGLDPKAHVVPAGTVAGFELCGADQVFVAANAVISGAKVIVSAPGVGNPVAARYAWKNFPLANLTAGDGRPVPPFRTDDFVGPFHPPVFDTGKFTSTVDRDAVFEASMSATDPNGGPLSYKVVGFDGPAADWLSIDPVTGAISGRPVVEGAYHWVVSVRDQAFNDPNSFNVAYADMHLKVGPPGSARADFIHPTPASTDAGIFNSSTDIHKLVNMGFSSTADVDTDAGGIGNSYVSLNTTNGLTFPVTLLFTLSSAADLTAFYLWNHANNNRADQPTFGVNGFDLEFYSDTAATVPIRSITGLSATKAPQTGEIPAQAFTFSPVGNVRAVKWVIRSNHGGAFLAAREIAFGAVPAVTLTLSSFTYDPVSGDAEVSIAGAANTNYKLVEAADLDFHAPDRDPIPLTRATVGTLDGNEVTTDSGGKATVRFNLGNGAPATFIRGEKP